MPRLRELALLGRTGDVEALRELLADQAGALEGLLDLPGAQIRAVTGLDDAAFAQAIQQIIRGARQRTLQARHQVQRDLATVAVARLVSGAIWSGEARVHLDPGLLLGPVLADSTCRYLGFHVDDACVHVERRRLLALRSVAPSLPGLAASVEGERLRFRWRDGRGGLDFRSLDLSRADREHVRHVVLVQPRQVIPAEPARLLQQLPNAQRSWFGEVLAELGLRL